MAGLLKKLFGGKKTSESVDDLVEDTIIGIIEKAELQLSYEINFHDEESKIDIDLFGEDDQLLKDRDGQLLDAIELFVTRVIQHNVEDVRMSVNVDCDGFREQADFELIKLADKLKNIVLKKKKSVYFRALPPKDRKLIHQHLADDGRVSSQSVGDGLYKKIKIFPKKGESQPRA